jgi:alpha-L-fucosidase
MDNDPASSHSAGGSYPKPTLLVGPGVEPVQTGPFQPTWESLSGYRVPRWFQDAKFGIWGHWGPQCQPERGDWYGRHMYMEDQPQGRFHRERYGHPSRFGFKDIIREWKAENWDPEELMTLYSRTGARYFTALANHHDNFDLYASSHQPWNSTRLGPRKDVIGGWAKAARTRGMRFGVSVHAAHAWTWYEPAQGADRGGPLAGVPYDGNLTRADGKGQWWEGLDPQDLYAQNHPVSRDDLHKIWGWEPGRSFCPPTAAYCRTFYSRTVELIDAYRPDLVYFDDTVLPLWPVSDAGPRIAAHFYNKSMQWHEGKLEAVLTAKILDELQRRCMVWDIERGQSNRIEPFPWQSETCIGEWHYDVEVFRQHRYKSAKTIVQTLADVVSKNGNLLLSVPIRGDGTIDADERSIVEGIASWMRINGECIFDTRPWKVFGEGPALDSAAPLAAQGFNEGKGKPFTADDVRFTVKGDALYVISLGTPVRGLRISSLGARAGLLDGGIAGIGLLGSDEKIGFRRDADALVIEPARSIPSDAAAVFKVIRSAG